MACSISPNPGGAFATVVAFPSIQARASTKASASGSDTAMAPSPILQGRRAQRRLLSRRTRLQRERLCRGAMFTVSISAKYMAGKKFSVTRQFPRHYSRAMAAAATDWPRRLAFSSGIRTFKSARSGYSALTVSMAVSSSRSPPEPVVTRPSTSMSE